MLDHPRGPALLDAVARLPGDQPVVDARPQLGERLQLRCALQVRAIRPALGIEVHDERGLQRVGQPHQPLVEMGALGRAQTGRQAGLGVGVAQVQADRGGFVEHQVTVLQHGDQAIGVERAVGGRVHHAEGHAGVAARQLDAEHLRAQHHLAHIDRADSAPEAQHGGSSYFTDSRMACASAAMPMWICSTLAVTNDRRSVRGSAWSA